MRPAKLIVGTPVSPDSPSVDIHPEGEICDILIDKKPSADPDSQFGVGEFDHVKKCESQVCI